MIDKLINTRGDVRTILGIDGDDVLDISRADWAKRYVVVRGLEFRRVRLADTKVSANFVECWFDQCEFRRIKSQSHFSGAGNTWNRCKFDGLELVDMIAPQSRFVDCEFRGTQIRGFRPCQTLFDTCRFENCLIQGIAPRSVGNPSMQLPEVAKTGSIVLFRACTFAETTMVGCRCDKVRFDDCRVSDTEFVNCDFSGAMGQDTWLKQVPKGDPFLAFLDALLAGIQKRLGSDSAAMRELSSYSESYRNGNTTSKDFGACLYSGRVPHKELDAIQDTLDGVEAAFPF